MSSAWRTSPATDEGSKARVAPFARCPRELVASTTYRKCPDEHAAAFRHAGDVPRADNELQ